MSDDLFDAVLRGDVAQVENALDAGADPNALDTGSPGWRPLHAAIEAIDEEDAPLALLQVLLERGANANLWDRDNDATPLLMAVFRAQSDSVRLLLAHGANPDIKGGEGDTPILTAIIEEQDDIIEMLLTHGIGESLQRSGAIEGTTPLGAAAVRGRLDLVERLLTAGADPRAIDYDRCTAMERAQSSFRTATGEHAQRLARIIERLQAAVSDA